MCGSVLVLELKTEQAVDAAIEAVELLLAEARDLDGFRDCSAIRTGTCELTMRLMDSPPHRSPLRATKQQAL
jgi:hypothetical protein